MRLFVKGQVMEEVIAPASSGGGLVPQLVSTLRSSALRARYGDALTFAGLTVEVSLNPQP